MSGQTPDHLPTSAEKRGHNIVHVNSPLSNVDTAHSDDPTLAQTFTMAEHMSQKYTNKSAEQVFYEASALCERCVGVEKSNNHTRDFQSGALLAWGMDNPQGVKPDLDEAEVQWLTKEFSKDTWDNFKIPLPMVLTAVLCGLSAVVQGMDQSAVNGAQEGYEEEFGITNQWIKGLVNAAPYVCCALIGCWTAPPLNKFFGRKGTIGISCAFAVGSGIWQMCAHSTWELFAARFCMGFAIGAKSSTTPAYAAECAPPKIRGAIGTQWQMWTAFGIMLGLVVDVAFMNIHTPVWGEYSGWRIILGSTAAPALVVLVLLLFVPESPRWYIINGKYPQAYKSLCRLRNCRVQATRDLYDIHATLEHEGKYKALHREGFFKRSFKLFTVSRNRRGAQSAGFVMLMQQMCGVNVIAYYSTQIFRDAGFDLKKALLFSFGAGVINWIFAIPGMLMIDKKGRRSLLLWTFPMMAACLLFTGSGFYITDSKTRLGVVGAGIMFFMVCYSPGMGPVPFTYSAEAYPLEVRDVGMSFATAVCWGFNAILALTFPAMSKAFGIGGAFYFYAAWNVVGFLYTYFFLPETKKLTLEMLDERFRVSLWQFARLNYYSLPWSRNRVSLPADLAGVRETMTREYGDVDASSSSSTGEKGSVLRRSLCCFGRGKSADVKPAPDPPQLVMHRGVGHSPDDGASDVSEKCYPVDSRNDGRLHRMPTPYPEQMKSHGLHVDDPVGGDAP